MSVGQYCGACGAKFLNKQESCMNVVQPEKDLDGSYAKRGNVPI